jgi:hypothetical protein
MFCLVEHRDDGEVVVSHRAGNVVAVGIGLDASLVGDELDERHFRSATDQVRQRDRSAVAAVGVDNDDTRQHDSWSARTG